MSRVEPDTCWADAHALVTGATRGIGRAVAFALAARGCRLALLGRDEERLAETVRECAELAPAGTPTPIAATVDLCDRGQVERLVPDLIDALQGRLHLLANVAGAAPFKERLEELELDAWQTTLEVNLLAPVLLQQLCFPALAAARGAVVNVGSVVADRAAPLSGPYAASKAALASLTRSTAFEWARHGIRAMTIEPGYVPTEFNTALTEAGLEDRLLARVPTGEPVSTEAVADAVLFVGAPGQVHLTGDRLRVDGGYSLRLG